MGAVVGDQLAEMTIDLSQVYLALRIYAVGPQFAEVFRLGFQKGLGVADNYNALSGVQSLWECVWYTRLYLRHPVTPRHQKTSHIDSRGASSAIDDVHEDKRIAEALTA